MRVGWSKCLIYRINNQGDRNEKYIAIAALMVAGSVQAGVVENYQIGGQSENRDRSWTQQTSLIGTTGAAFEFASATDAQLVFTVTATAANNDLLVLGSNFLSTDSSARQTDTHLTRLSDDESVTVTVSYVDPNNSLISLKVKEFGAFWGQGATETTVFTDASANSHSLVAFNHNDPETLIDYSTTGLDALTKDNTGTWSLTASAGSCAWNHDERFRRL